MGECHGCTLNCVLRVRITYESTSACVYFSHGVYTEHDNNRYGALAARGNSRDSVWEQVCHAMLRDLNDKVYRNNFST